jgi:hypothetical protein
MKMSRAMLLILFMTAVIRPAAATDLATYDRALAHVNAALDAEVSKRGPGGSNAPLRIARTELAPIADVRTPEGAAITVNTREVVAAIEQAYRRRRPDRRRQALSSVETRITALREDLATAARMKPAGAAGSPSGAAAPAASGAGRDPSAELHAVLKGDAYQSSPQPPPSWLEETWQKIEDWLKKKGTHTSTPSISPTFVRAIFILLIAALVALLVAIIVPLIVRRGAQPKAPRPDLDEEEALVEQRDGDRLLTLAEQKAAAGDYRLAFRLVYLATLIALDSGGVLRFDRSKTNWEYLRALQMAGRTDVADKMRPMTRTFDRVWYGLSPAGAIEFERAMAQHQALTAAPQPAK